MAKSVILLITVLIISLTASQAFASNVPDWIKNTALWYGEGKISETEFLNAIKFLIENKILVINEPNPEKSINQECSGSAKCITGIVSEIIDGDTIIVEGQSIRFTLTDAPEIYSSTEKLSEQEVANGHKARNVVVEYCPLGSTVLIDEDDGQTKGSYGRIIALVYCNGVNLNETVLDQSTAKLYSKFCSQSEFANQAWAKKHGC